ncbi:MULTISPECIES: helix-turn-helix transcriptional regulator [unclassified Cedecea]|uniref:helix-turn-helix transcriptional regulator n=1 Tax=unclassified Cedecea TaxID=2649846 RepID=UPI003016D3A8
MQHVKSDRDIREDLHNKCYIIIDTYENNLFHSDFEIRIRRLNPRRVYILGPFLVNRLWPELPVVFLKRTTAVMDFFMLIHGRAIGVCPPDILLTRKQHLVLTYLIQEMSPVEISTRMGVSIKAFYAHQFNIMELFKAKKVGCLIVSGISKYLIKSPLS